MIKATKRRWRWASWFDRLLRGFTTSVEEDSVHKLLLNVIDNTGDLLHWVPSLPLTPYSEATNWSGGCGTRLFLLALLLGLQRLDLVGYLVKKATGLPQVLCCVDAVSFADILRRDGTNRVAIGRF